MRVTVFASNFRPGFSERMILDKFKPFTRDWVIKTRPTRIRIKLRLGGKKLRVTNHAVIGAFFMMIPVFSGKRALGSALESNGTNVIWERFWIHI